MTETPPWPTSARAVVIGAGIVGNSLAGHLAELGWTDLVQVSVRWADEIMQLYRAKDSKEGTGDAS